MRIGSNEATLTAWLKNSGLDNGARIWQEISIKQGWETAFEAILGARLNAIANNGEFMHKGRPPAVLTLAMAAPSVNAKLLSNNGHQSTMYSLIEKIEPGYQAVLQDWLTGAYWAIDAVDMLAESKNLRNGECLVNKHATI